METITFGRRAGAAAAEWARTHTTVEVPPTATADADRALRTLLDRTEGERPWKIRDELAHSMHRNFGLFRREAAMREQAALIEELRERYSRVLVDDKGTVFNNDVTQAIELGNLLDLAACMVAPGIERRESRGAHSRPDDYPARDDERFLRHSLVTWEDGKPSLSWKPVTITRWEPAERSY
jgi:succinate dehydrogenase / fumarate reductase flavoprotein subunit